MFVNMLSLPAMNPTLEVNEVATIEETLRLARARFDGRFSYKFLSRHHSNETQPLQGPVCRRGIDYIAAELG